MTKKEISREWKLLFKEHGEEIEADELTDMLDAYTVEFPPEHIIQNAIDSSLIQLSQVAANASHQQVSIKRLWHMLSLQIEYLSKWFWLFSILLFISGYLMTEYGSFNPYKVILLLSPMPIILGILELIRNVESGMAEIELACKMSMPQAVMARLVVIGTHNIVLNSIISLAFYWSYGIDFWQVVLFWLVPFTWISSIVLLLATKFRGRLLVPITLGIWMIALFSALSNAKVFSYLLTLNLTLCVLFAVVGCVLLWLQARHLYSYARSGMLTEMNA